MDGEKAGPAQVIPQRRASLIHAACDAQKGPRWHVAAQLGDYRRPKTWPKRGCA